MLLNDVKVILSRVSESGNAGAVCRTMKTMGLFNLRLASPLPLTIEKISARAVNSMDIWENADIFDNLADAVADCSIVVGTTRRRGHNRKSVSMTPRDLALWLTQRPGPAAIVFGNERTGLEEAELELCNFASHIPVSETQPSLNLSHAVQIYAYELFLAMEQQFPVKGEWTAMNQTEISELVCSITDKLKSIGFYKKPGREEQERFLRDVISRAGLSISEGKYFKNIITKAEILSR
ncbi:MAG: RNA methyltransferase [Treponema sp.]|nr:RNA methyltransferase [Treponema sp.]